MKHIKKLLLFITITSLLLALAGCGGSQAQKVNVNEVKTYADSAAQKIFTGISEGNYDNFSEDFDQQMKAALTTDKFNQITNQLGKCESWEITDADSIQGYIRAYYKTKFAKISSDVTFTIVFSTTGDHKVSGLFYK